MQTSKAVFNFDQGSITVEGSSDFVAKYLEDPEVSSRLMKALAAATLVSGDDDRRAALEQSINHTWSWFELHATHRMQSVNFFLVAVAFLTAAYVSALHYAHPLVAIGVSVVAVFLTVVFNRFELRIRELLHHAEAALEPLQATLAGAVGVEGLRLTERVKKPRRPFTAYSKVITALHWITACAFFLASVYAGYEWHKAPRDLRFHVSQNDGTRAIPSGTPLDRSEAIGIARPPSEVVGVSFSPQA